MSALAKILVIDDEAGIRKLLRLTLQAQGYAMHEAESGEAGLREAALVQPDLVVLDLSLPDDDGLLVLRRLREWSTAAVIVLSVREDESDKVSALDYGADDYVTKPFLMGELLARIRVALRRPRGDADEPILRFGPITLDLANHVVWKNGEAVRLTPLEYGLFAELALRRGRVLTHRHLLDKVWGITDVESGSSYLRVYVGHLRRKLERDPARPQLILTEPGVGYRLVDPEARDTGG